MADDERQCSNGDESIRGGDRVEEVEEVEEVLSTGGRRNDSITGRRPKVRGQLRFSVTKYDVVTVASLVTNLPEELASCFADGERHVMVVELDDFRYVQFLVTEGKLLITEAASNLNQHPDHLLSDDQQAALVEIGFTEPEQGNPNQPNFHLEGQGIEAVLPAAVAASRVLREVYGVRPGEHLKVKRFHSLPDDEQQEVPESIRGLV